MSTKYFILSKPAGDRVDDGDNTQIVVLNRRETHILPQNNLAYYANNGLFESGMIEWCRQFCGKDKVFLDIGAHSGTYTISLAAYSKQVYSFEPRRMTYYALCGSVALSGLENVECLKYGLGSSDQVGAQTLKIVSNDGGGSSLHSTEGILREESIRVRTLDSFAITDVGFIKMDVEDNELYVLRGAKQTIEVSNYPPILFESNHENRVLFAYIAEELGYGQVIAVSGSNNMYLATR